MCCIGLALAIPSCCLWSLVSLSNHRYSRHRAMCMQLIHPYTLFINFTNTIPSISLHFAWQRNLWLSLWGVGNVSSHAEIASKVPFNKNNLASKMSFVENFFFGFSFCLQPLQYFQSLTPDSKKTCSSKRVEDSYPTHLRWVPRSLQIGIVLRSIVPESVSRRPSS